MLKMSGMLDTVERALPLLADDAAVVLSKGMNNHEAKKKDPLPPKGFKFPENFRPRKLQS